MHQKNKLMHLLTLLGACFVFILSKPAFASFEVIDGSDGEFYGNAQNRTFKNAVEGFESLDERDKAFLASVEESRNYKRWYGRVLFGQPRSTLKNMKNTSSGGRFVNPVPPPAFITYPSGVPLTEVQSKDDLFTGILGWGYRWLKWAIEVEALFNETLKYQARPIMPGVPLNVTADVTQLAVLFNVEYTFDHWFDFHPDGLDLFVLAGAGGNFYSADTTTLYLNGQARISDSTEKANLIWQLGFGLRYQISPHFLVTATYRYIDLKEVKFGPLDAGLSFEAGKNRLAGGFLGLIYQL